MGPQKSTGKMLWSQACGPDRQGSQVTMKQSASRFFPSPAPEVIMGRSQLCHWWWVTILKLSRAQRHPSTNINLRLSASKAEMPGSQQYLEWLDERCQGRQQKCTLPREGEGSVVLEEAPQSSETTNSKSVCPHLYRENKDLWKQLVFLGLALPTLSPEKSHSKPWTKRGSQLPHALKTWSNIF